MFSVLSRRFVNFSARMAKNALVVVADGSEEMEAVITIDVLRRANVNVTVAGLTGQQAVKCSRGVAIVPDNSLEKAKSAATYDAIILPGGMPGAKSFAASELIGEILKEQESAGRICAAICAAPIAFKSHQIAKGKQLTSHPVVKGELEEAGYPYLEQRVVVDGTTVTSRGPGTAFEFALKLVELLEGKDKKAEIMPPMILPENCC